MQLTYFRGLHYNIEKKLHGDVDRITQNSPRGHNDPLEGSTANRLSEKYSISPRTIKRDGQIADVIVAIGKESMEAKNSILSGEARISRKQLRELSSATEDGIAEKAIEIETGKYEAGNKSATSNVSNESANRHPLVAEIINQTKKFIKIVQSPETNADSDDLKKSIRSFIINLEDLNKQI